MPQVDIKENAKILSNTAGPDYYSPPKIIMKKKLASKQSSKLRGSVLQSHNSVDPSTGFRSSVTLDNHNSFRELKNRNKIVLDSSKASTKN